jgi:hypothetical protein
MQPQRRQVLQDVDKIRTQKRLTPLNKHEPDTFGIEKAKDAPDLLSRQFISSLVQRKIAVATGGVATKGHLKRGQDRPPSHEIDQRPGTVGNHGQ